MRSRVFLFHGLVAGLSLPVLPAQSQPSGSASPARKLAEAEAAAWLGSSARFLKIALIAEEGRRTGDHAEAMTQLAELAREAMTDKDHEAWLEAELHWLRFAAEEEDEDGSSADLEQALDTLVMRARDWRLPHYEASVLTFWAETLEKQNTWRRAMVAHDMASQASLAGGRINAGLRSLIEMARLARANDHPWRLQQAWVRIDQVLRDRPGPLDEGTRLRLESERSASAPELAALPAVAAVDDGAGLQPIQSAVRVSASHGELGRTQFFLTNASSRPAGGTLTIAPQTGAVTSWRSGAHGHYVTVQSAAKPVARSRFVNLRPGAQTRIYVERDAADTVALTWEDSSGRATAAATFTFAKNQPQTSVVNAGEFHLHPGWTVPVYHEINHRGDLSLTDVQFTASVPCRLEIFDADDTGGLAVETGRLLAIDGEGDGWFTGPADLLLADLDSSGIPDISISDTSRSLEIHAWPLEPLAPGQSITVRANLRRPGQTLDPWRTDAENTVEK